MELSIEDIKNKFEKLPEDLKWAIMSAKIDEKVLAIGQNFSLNIRQMGQLSLEVHAVMLGYMHPDDFENSILKSLNLGEEKTKLLANSVYEKIIKDVRERLIEYRGGVKPTKDIVEKKLPKEIFEKKEETQKEIITPEIKPEDKKEEISNEITEDKKVINNIISNKLQSNIKSVKTETDHSVLQNGETKSPEIPVKKIDPYREIPE